MKTFTGLVAAAVIVISACGKGQITGSASPEGPPASFNFKTVTVDRPLDTPRTVVLAVTILYTDSRGLDAEIKSKEDELTRTVSEFARGLKASESHSVADYDAAHNELTRRINAILKRGSINKVLFRKIEMY